jgi:hypothetical protein
MQARSRRTIPCAALSLLLAGACADPRVPEGGDPRVAPAEASAPPAAVASGTSVFRHGAPSAGAATFDAAKPARLLVRRVATGHLLVQPVVNGIQAGWFIFDTGAGICVVSTPHAEELQLEAVGELDANGIGGGAKAEFYRAATFELGPLALRDHPLMVTDLSFLKAHLGEEIVGVVGFGVLSQCVAEIDPVEERISIFDPAAYVLADCDWTPVDLADRIPALEARFEGHAGLFHIDTGANTGVSFSANAVTRWKLLEGREVQDAKLGGVGGFLAAKRGKLAWFEIGGLRQEQVSATFPLEGKGVLGGHRIDGSLGAEVLRPFVLVTDYARERIALRAR